MVRVSQRINGNNTASYINKDVTLLGQVINLESSGRSFKLRCCDDQILLVQMKQPMQEPIEPGTYIEVEGKVSSRNLIACERHFIIDPNLTENFDRKLYCDAINLLLTTGLKNNYIIDDIIEHHGSGDTIELLMNESENKQDMDFQDASFLNL